MKNIFCIISLAFISFIAQIAISHSEIDCDQQTDIMCYYNEAEKIALIHYESDKYLPEKIYIRAQKYYDKFLNFVETNNHNFENNILINAYISSARVNDFKKFSDFNLIERNTTHYHKAYDLGAKWSFYYLCNTIFEVYFYNKSPDIDESSKVKLEDYLKEADNYCHKFIDENISEIEIYNNKSTLEKSWNLDIKKFSSVEVYHNLMFIYQELGDSLKSMEYAFKAEDALTLNKEDLDEYQKEVLSALYNSIGYAYEYSYGVANDLAKAIYYYEIASELDNTYAIGNLADIYQYGRYGELNFKKAVDLYNKLIELSPKSPWAHYSLGEIYLYGFGVDIDAKKAKSYFEEVVLIHKFYEQNKDEYYSHTIEVAQSARDFADVYLLNWDNERDFQVNTQICFDAQDNFEKGFPAFHLFQKCKDLADNNVLLARKTIIDFYEYGIVVPKNPELAFQMASELITELKEARKNKNWNKFLVEVDNSNLTDSDHDANFLDYIQLLQSHIANSIFWGRNSENPEIAYNFLDTILLNNENYPRPFQNVNKDLWYQLDWYMYNLMKIEGWGTKKDLETVGNTIVSLEKNFRYLLNNPDEIDDLHTISEVETAIRDLEYVKDKYKQAKSGYSIKSRILFAFPATYYGRIFWKDGYDSSLEIEINSIKKLGYQNYSISGFIKYINNDGSISEQYILKGVLDPNNGLVNFDEIDSGDNFTLDLDYGAGKYYGKFNEDYSSFIGQFVFSDQKGHGHVEVFKNENLTTKVDYKKRIGIGKQYAVLIGNNNYKNLAKLETATADARSLADVLQNKYGFIVEPPLINATRNEILMKLSYLSNALDPEDSLLIFYAGHGRQDEDTGRGYWSPIDAYSDNFINDISNDDITNTLKKISSKHILVIADSCYSGTLVLRGDSILNKGNELPYLKKLAKKESRKALTSGALQPVSDTGENGHSAFANSLLKVLTENERIISANELHQSIRPLIMSKYSQTPLYNVVGDAGDEGGEFLFIPIQ